MKALDIGPGDEVIVTPRTFIASVSCVVNQGATPVFADVDSRQRQHHAETVRAVITDRTRAIVPVHLGGWPCDMEASPPSPPTRGPAVIEDCAQAHGATIERPQRRHLRRDRRLVVLPGQDHDHRRRRRDGQYRRPRSCGRACGRTRTTARISSSVFSNDHPPGFRWVHDSFGSNYRMLEVQSVIGRIQLRRLADWHGCGPANAAAVRERLARLPGGACGCPSRRADSCMLTTGSTLTSVPKGFEPAGPATGSLPSSPRAARPPSRAAARKCIWKRRSTGRRSASLAAAGGPRARRDQHRLPHPPDADRRGHRQGLRRRSARCFRKPRPSASAGVPARRRPSSRARRRR